MDAEQVDERVTAKVAELMQENQQQLTQEMSSLLQKLSDQTSSPNKQQLLKIRGIIATGETPKFKKKINEEQYKLNAKVLVKLDETEQFVDSTYADKVKEKHC